MVGIKRREQRRQTTDPDETLIFPAIDFSESPHMPAFDTYDVVLSGVGPVITGMQDYEIARTRARQVSAWHAGPVVYLYYGGFYDYGRRRMPRALAAFRFGDQLPYIARITSIESDGLRRIWGPIGK